MYKKSLAISALVVILVLLLAACGGQAGTGKANIAGSEWVLSSLNGKDPIAGSTVTIKFDANEAGGNSGCNTYGGKYTAGQDGKLVLEEVVMTEMACMEPEGVMEQEMTYLETLTQAASYQVTGDRLEIKNASGETILVFTKAG